MIGEFILVWREGDTTPWRNLSSQGSNPYPVFEASNGDVFARTGNTANVSALYKWTGNATVGILVPNTNMACFDLFIDDASRLYCSITYGNIVTRMALNDSTNTSTVVAGNGTAGNTSDLLYLPVGIFVTDNYTLFVTDGLNNRIQRFSPGELSAVTVAGAGAPGTAMLAGPWSVVLDALEYMFIVEYFASRIVSQGPHGFRCIAGCSSGNGSASNQLFAPIDLSFDSHGNIFVVDYSNQTCAKVFLGDELLR